VLLHNLAYFNDNSLILLFTGSHSAWVLVTYIKGNTQFPEFSITVMLDDITVGYYDSETRTYVTRGNTTNEDDMYNLGDNTAIRELLYDHLVDKLRMRLIKKANSDSGGFRVSCLATGFYPRHINLTLFRDEQPVADHEITGGDLLPNDDGTYQMRKSLEISAADKHTYTCSATHLRETFKQVISSVLVVLALGLVLITVIGVIKWQRRRHSGNT
uniref:Ig-like domain-containing protein n=1 Tax=Cyprinus carpio TaxID=7962 RepID=A0A8C1S8E8_CYPCA